jgi:hypothetical protein
MHAVAWCWRAALSGLAIAVLLLASAKAALSEPVDVELVLAVDTSGSMKAHELRLQRQGYAAAFRSREVINAILDGVYGRVAVTYVEWGASGSRRVILPWTRIASEADAHRVADALEQAAIKSLFQTSIAGAIRYGQRALGENQFEGNRRVIDISGDGPNNQGGLVTISRDVAVGEGITINGLPLAVRGGVLKAEDASLDTYYADCVIGGPRAFLLPVSDWDQFPEAVRRKLVLELADAPIIETWAIPFEARVWKSSGRATDCRIGEKLWWGMEPG